MKKFLALLIGIGLFMGSGCAYFNTFYNAKQAYRKGQEQTQKQQGKSGTTAGQSDYARAIDKCQKVIDLYPTSRYVDDALLLMAKSYYYQNQFHPSLRQLNVLHGQFPQSELRDEAALLQARNHLALDQLDSARQILERLMDRVHGTELSAEALLIQGEIAEKRQDFPEAVHFYEDALESGIKKNRFLTYMAIAAVHDTLGQYQESLFYWDRVRETDAPVTVKIKARLRYAQDLGRLGRGEEAIRILERLLGSERNKAFFGRIRLAIAQVVERQGKLDEAILAYQDLTLDFPKTKEASEAYYRLGHLFEIRRHDYETALENYHAVGESGSQSVFSDSASVKKRDIQRLLALRQVIAMADRGETGDLEVQHLPRINDSTSTRITPPDSMSTLTRQDSIQQGLIAPNSGQQQNQNFMNMDAQREQGRGTDPFKGPDEGSGPAKLIENPELKSFRTEEADKNLFLLAELYLFRFAQPDSAMRQYRRIIAEHPDSPYRVRALYNLAYIQSQDGNEQEAEITRQSILSDYPETPQALQLQKMPKISAENKALSEAEALLWRPGLEHDAYSAYAQIVNNSPLCPEAPKALYAMAYIAEVRWDSLGLARVHFDSLAQRYPDTPQGQKAKEKIQAAEKGLPKLAPKVEASQETPSLDSLETTITDTLTLQEDQIKRRKQELLEDEKRPPSRAIRRRPPLQIGIVPVDGMEALRSAVLAIYPDELRDSELAPLHFKLKLSIRGQVIDAHLEKGTGIESVDEAIITLVKNTMFTNETLMSEDFSDFILPLNNRTVEKSLR